MAGEALNITLLDASWPPPDVLRAPTVCQTPRGAEMDKPAWPLSWKKDVATMTSGGNYTATPCTGEKQCNTGSGKNCNSDFQRGRATKRRVCMSFSRIRGRTRRKRVRNATRGCEERKTLGQSPVEYWGKFSVVLRHLLVICRPFIEHPL